MNALKGIGKKFRRAEGRKSRVESAGLDAFAERLTPLYLVLTAALALLGYAYVFAFPVLAVVFLGRATFHAMRLEWIALLYTALCLVAVWFSFLLTRIRPAPPDKHLLPESAAPKLVQFIEHARTQRRAPRLTHLMLDDGLDVRLVRTPRNAYPLWFAYSLIVGLPALQLFTPLQFKGLLVRRLGQAAGREHRFLRWLILWRDFGPTLLATCSGWRRTEHILIRVFFVGYSRLYRWWSVPAARIYELRIDHYMMSSINDRDVAELLAAQVIAERYLKERYFPSLLKMARRRPHPLPVAYSGLDRKFNRYWRTVDAKLWLNQAHASRPRAGETRPALARRLLEIGHSTPRLPPPMRQAASRVLLGGFLKHALAKQDGLWMRRVLPQWRDLHQLAKREVQRLHRLYDKSRRTRLDLAEARELASLVERCYGQEKAVPFYRHLLINNPNDANVSFAAGRFLLSVGDPHGVRALQRAMRLDPRFSDPVTSLLESHALAQRSVPKITPKAASGPDEGQIIVEEINEISRLN